MSNRLGRTQSLIVAAVRSEAAAWLADDDMRDRAADASMTLLRLYERLPGRTADEIKRSADALVARGLLRVTRVGWALSPAQFADLATAATA